MTSDGLMILIPVGLLFIFFVVALIMSRKSWKFFHIFCCFLLLVGYVFFMGLSALALKTRVAWSKVYNEQTAELEKQQTLQTKLEKGDPFKVKPDWDLTPDEDRSLVDAVSQLVQETRGLGRVWRHCTVPEPFDGTQVVVRMTSVPAPGEEATATAPHRVLCDCEQCTKESLETSNLIYVFREDPNLKHSPPVAYLGEFQADSGTPDTVTLVPSMIVNSLNYNLVELQNPTAPWALYTLMPADVHGLYQDRAIAEQTLPPERVGLTETAAQNRYRNMLSDLKEFYETMDAEDQLTFLKRLAADDPSIDEAALTTVDQALQAIYQRNRLGLNSERIADQYERLIDSFVHDGTSLKDIPADSPLVDEQSPLKATPEEIWVKVKFLKDMKEPNHVDVGKDLAVASPFKVDALTRPANWAGMSEEDKRAEIQRQINDRYRETFDQRNPAFDTEGAATVPEIMHSNDVGDGIYVEFSKDQEAIFDSETAAQLEDDQVVEVVDRIFRRRLNDFGYHYREVDAGGRRLNQKAEDIQRDFAATYEAIKAVEEQIAQTEVQIQKLQQDRGNFQQEEQLIRAFRDKLENDIAKLQQDFVTAYRETKTYESLLAELDRQVRKDIDRQVRAGATEE